MPEAKWFVAYEFFSASMDVIEMTGSDSSRRGARVPSQSLDLSWVMWQPYSFGFYQLRIKIAFNLLHFDQVQWILHSR